jgi:hypothetical protein
LINLHTLLYAYENYCFLPHSNAIQFKSSCPNDNDYLSYNHTHQLYYYSSSLFNSVLSHICFSNLRDLFLELLLNDYFPSIFPRLDQFITLNIWTYDDCDNTIAQSQLQMLLDWAPRLSTLGIQCQTLIIGAKNRTNILDLINSMINLRAMSVRCEEDGGETIEWLRNRLPLRVR